MHDSSQQDELAAVRETLREAEDICRAIQSGEVDAVIVGKSEDEKRVLLMSGAYTRYRQLVEDMDQGAVTIARSGDILFTNQSFAAMVGRSPREVFRTPFESWVAEADRRSVDAIKAGELGQEPIHLKLKRRDGEILPVRISQVSASDDFVTVLVTDTSPPDEQRGEAEAMVEAIRSGRVDAFVVDGKQIKLLDSANALYRNMVERMRQGAVTVTDGGEIVYANERFISMAGVPHGRLMRSKLADLVADGDQAAFRSIMNKEQAEAELRLRTSNGQTVSVVATMAGLDGHKLFLFTDITERKRHQASDELTRKFLGMLAHEFRNILGPIVNSAELLKRGAGLDAEGQKAVATIERQSARLLALVEDLRKVNPKE
jgi:PAS domain S-box-containing protein